MSAETFFAKSRECCWLKRSCSRSCLIMERSRQTRQLDCTSSQPLRLLCAWSLTSNQCCDISVSVFCWPNPYSAHVCFEPAFSICGILRSCCRSNRRNSSNPWICLQRNAQIHQKGKTTGAFRWPAMAECSGSPSSASTMSGEGKGINPSEKWLLHSGWLMSTWRISPPFSPCPRWWVLTVSMQASAWSRCSSSPAAFRF